MSNDITISISFNKGPRKKMTTSLQTTGELPATRDQVVGLLELLATRMQWSVAKSVLSQTSLHVSRGWQETISAAKQDTHSNAAWNNAYKTLSENALWSTYVGNKRVSFFDLRSLTENDHKEILAWIKKQASNDLNKYIEDKPFCILSAPTAAKDLEKFKGKPPVLIETASRGTKFYLQYFSTRTYIQKTPLDITSMSDTQQKFFEEYEELIGVKKKSVPCFDTIVFDHSSDLIEVRLDFQPGMTEDKKAPAFERVVGELNHIVNRFVGPSALGAGLMNLYPAINPLYLDEKCGSVTALGFVATGRNSSSNNHGKIHRTKTKDFRKDEFHLGGKLHVDRIDPYAIGITWRDTPPKNDLYLEIKGSARAIYSGKLSAVTEAEIVGCLNGRDFDFVAKQVLSRLKRKEK